MSQRTAHRLAWSTATFSVVVATTGLVLSLVALIVSDGILKPAPHQFFNPVTTFTYSIVGALIASRQSRNPIGWMFVGTGLLVGLDLLILGYSMVGYAVAAGGAIPGTELTRWLDNWVWIPSVALPMTFLMLLFPDGQLLSSRWRPVAWLAALGLLSSILGAALYPGSLYELAEPNLVGTKAGATEAVVLLSGGTIFLVVSILLSIASLVIRFRRSTGMERQQLKWLVYAGTLVILGFVVTSVMAVVWPNSPMIADLIIIITDATLVGIVIAAGIAIIRHRLYDIDLLINRTLVYGTLTAVVVGSYMLAVVSLGALLQARGNLSISLLATGMIAVSFQPLRGRLQRGVNRLMYGERDEPYRVLSRLGRRLEATLAHDAVLPTIVETVAQALKLPYVAIALRKGQETEIAATVGRQTENPILFPLTYQAEIMGHLICAPRSPGEPFNAAEQQLLEDMAHQAGVAIHAARLTTALQDSRERLVTAREEERRRLRRDLHDGLGPTLAALHLQAATLRRLIRKDPEAAEFMVGEFSVEIKAVIDEIRRLVYELRPPTIDELGLVGAIRAQAAQCSLQSVSTSSDTEDRDLQVVVNAPEDLPPLPAAVEVAAYRIVQEALTNVARHAQASNCVIRLDPGENLQLEITDNGIGLAAERETGVGLHSMRERAEELGGTFLIQSAPENGTRVLARLPVSKGVGA